MFNWLLSTIDIFLGKISAQPHSTLCIQFLNRENNDKNNTFPLGKQICFTIVWGCAETLPFSIFSSPLWTKMYCYWLRRNFPFGLSWERTAESLLIDDCVVKSLGSWFDCICIGFESWRIQHFLSLWLLHCRQCSVLDWSITHHLLPCGWLLQSQDTGCLAEGIFSGECSVIQFCSVLAQMTRAGQRNWFNFFKSWKIVK